MAGFQVTINGRFWVTAEANTAGSSQNEIVSLLRHQLSEIYEDHIRPSYQSQREQAEALQLIIGIVPPAVTSIEETRLYVSSQTIIRETGPYDFVGFGRDLAYYLMGKIVKNEDLYAHDKDLRSDYSAGELFLPGISTVVGVAQRIISEIGENVPYCGREAKILRIPAKEAASYI